MPKVENLESLSPTVKKLWSAFVERTQKHELRHVRHVEQSAPQIFERIRDEHLRAGSVSPQRAQSLISDVIAEIKAKDRRYDGDTNHGQTEGTWRIVRLG